MWRPGQKIVCINDRFDSEIWNWVVDLPKEGCIYTVRRSYSGSCIVTREASWGVHLVEIVNPDWPSNCLPGSLAGEVGFLHWRFKEAELEAEREEEREEEREDALALPAAGGRWAVRHRLAEANSRLSIRPLAS